MRMRTCWTLAMLVGFTGCYNQYYVADVKSEGGGLVVTKCAFDGRGDATEWCHDEPVDGYVDNEVDVPPDPPTLAAAKRAVERATPAPHPAPSDDAIAQAFGARGVVKLVEMCRQAYAKDVAALQFAVTVEPDGEIAGVEPHGVTGPFAECTQRALKTANVAPFDGKIAVTSEQRIVL